MQSVWVMLRTQMMGYFDCKRMGHSIGDYLPKGKAVLPIIYVLFNPNYKASLVICQCSVRMWAIVPYDMDFLSMHFGHFGMKKASQIPFYSIFYLYLTMLFYPNNWLHLI